MVTDDKLVTEILLEQYRRFKDSRALNFTNTNEELDEATRKLGIRNLYGLREFATFHVFMSGILHAARWN